MYDYCYGLVLGECMEYFANELAQATRNYGRGCVIGKGGFGTVYKGSLRYSTVAIKVLNKVRINLNLKKYAVVYNPIIGRQAGISPF